MTLAEQYVYKIHQMKSFSAAARALFVSQPALSATVARHEKELGFRIFDRSTSPLTLTPEGRIYLDALEEIAEAERIMKRRLSQLSSPPAHAVQFGGHAYAAQHLLPLICGEHVLRHPSAQLSIDMTISVSPIFDKLSARVLDLVMTYDFDQRRFSAVPLFEELRVIVVPKCLPGAEALAPLAVTRRELLSRSYPAEKCLTDLSVFESIPFLPSRADTALSSFLQSFLKGVATSPHGLLNSHSLSCNYMMICAGLAAGVSTETIIATMPDPGDRVMYFVPAASSARAPLSLIYAKGAELSPAASAFIETAVELCRDGRILSRFAEPFFLG